MGLGLAGKRRLQARGFHRGAARDTRALQPSIKPPFYRIFWFFHNVSLVATPVSFGMWATRLYEGR